MKQFIYSTIICLALLLIMDFAWLSIMAQRFYKPYLGHIFTKDFNYLVAFVFYTLYAFGISYLLVVPTLNFNISQRELLMNGFVLGLVTYGAYDLTNQATIKDWPLAVTCVDMLWGGVLTSVATSATHSLLYSFLR